MTYDGNLLTVYVDGSPAGSAAASTVLGNPGDYKVGGRPQNTFLDGYMDEIRLSDVARTAGEIAATWADAVSCP